VGRSKIDLRRVDLNLLLAFDVLLAERNVTRAAERLHVGQSAMSSTLARLRRLLNDRVLVRRGRMLVATPLAESLVEPVRDILHHVEQLLGDREFDARSAERTFSMVVSDRTTLTFLRPFVSALSVEWPGIKLHVHPASSDHVGMLERGEADLVVIPREVFPSHLRFAHEVLYEDRFVCVVDAGNPQVGETLTLEQFSSLPYLATTAPGSRSLAEMRLDSLGISRRVRVEASLGHAELLIRGGPFVTVLTERLARELNRDGHLRLMTPPMTLPPITEIMVWEPRTDRDPGSQWLREQVRRLTQRSDP
jgi:DNA-binding transcriptional LysR family regulator